jgi:hypothetical protein
VGRNAAFLKKIFFYTTMTFFKIFTSKRGGKKLTSNEFCYNLRRETNTTCIWRCENRSCFGAARTDDANFQLTRNHNHEPNENYCQGALINAEITNRALLTTERPVDIFINLLLVTINCKLICWQKQKIFVIALPN